MRTVLLAATLLSSPAIAHADSRASLLTPYSVQQPVYTCGSGDQSLAINGLLANGGDVEIAAGTCLLAHGLVLSVSGTTLNGAGVGQTILKAMTPKSIDLITVGLAKTNYSAHGFTVSNLTTDDGLLVAARTTSKVGRGVVVEGGVHADATNPLGATIASVETRYGLDGVSVAGSNVLVSNLNTHGNRHAGMYVGGNSNMPSPYGYADGVVIKGSHADGNNLDNLPGKTWDDIDFDVRTSHGTVGGPNAGDGNEVSGGDILLSCTPRGSGGACSGTIGPFLVQNNLVASSDQAGIRVYGLVDGATVTGNTMTVSLSGINVVGPVTNSAINANVIQGPIAYGVNVFPLAGSAPGNGILVQSNTVRMGNIHKLAFSVTGANYVTLQNNDGGGAPYATSAAGAALVMIGNR